MRASRQHERRLRDDQLQLRFFFLYSYFGFFACSEIDNGGLKQQRAILFRRSGGHAAKLGVNYFTVSLLESQFGFNAVFPRTATQQMMQEDRCVFAPDQDSEGHPDQTFAAQSEKASGRQINFRNPARAIEADVAGRREIIKLYV